MLSSCLQHTTGGPICRSPVLLLQRAREHTNLQEPGISVARFVRPLYTYYYSLPHPYHPSPPHRDKRGREETRCYATRLPWGLASSRSTYNADWSPASRLARLRVAFVAHLKTCPRLAGNGAGLNEDSIGDSRWGGKGAKAGRAISGQSDFPYPRGMPFTSQFFHNYRIQKGMVITITT